MNSLPLVTSRRVWFVQDLAVWGLPSLGEHDYLLLENSTSGSSVFYGSAVLSEASQEVIFSDLRDHRGNKLPGTLSSPRIFIRPKSEGSAFIVGRETPTGFRIARDSQTTHVLNIDLLVVELGD